MVTIHFLNLKMVEDNKDAFNDILERYMSLYRFNPELFNEEMGIQMNDTQQKQLGATLWGIADKLRGAMNADDFRDYCQTANYNRV